VVAREVDGHIEFQPGAPEALGEPAGARKDLEVDHGVSRPR
jgi:hypothetical protein